MAASSFVSEGQNQKVQQKLSCEMTHLILVWSGNLRDSKTLKTFPVDLGTLSVCEEYFKDRVFSIVSDSLFCSRFNLNVCMSVSVQRGSVCLQSPALDAHCRHHPSSSRPRASTHSQLLSWNEFGQRLFQVFVQESQFCCCCAQVAAFSSNPPGRLYLSWGKPC